MSTVVKDLGAVSAYAYAVEKGYTGTEAEFAELMADYAEVGQRAEDAADRAEAALDEFTSVTADATTLPEGSSATAEYSDGQLTFGIPKGDKGDGAYHVESSGESFVIHTDASGVAAAQEFMIYIDARQGTTKKVISRVEGLPSISTGSGTIAPEIIKHAFTGSVATIIYTIPANTQISAGQINAQYTAYINDGTANGFGVRCSLSVAVVKDGAKGDKGDTGDKGDKGDKGDTGNTGNTPNLTIGTVTTLQPTAPATATITGTADNPVLSFGIPKGDTGEVSQAQFDELAGDVTQLKSEFTAFESDGVVPSAEQMLSENVTVDSVPYHFRKTASDNADREELEIVGGSVAWNQLIKESATEQKTDYGLTSVINNHVYTLSGEIIQAGSFMIDGNIPMFAGHKYIITGINKVNGVSFRLYSPEAGTMVAHMGPVLRVVSISVSGNYQVYFFAQNVGNVVDVECIPQLIDLTAMFGSTIADYIYSLEQATAGAGVAFFKKLFPNDYYEYNAGELKSVEGVSAHVMRDADSNIIGNYPLDSTLTLRGLFKLDANNQLYADGDTYEYTGKVTRNTILRAYQSGDESLANAITDGTNTVVYSANASTEQADPYQHLQQCDPSGTEEYVSTGIVPIGHNTKYPDNLRMKLDNLPWNFANLIAPTESTFTATRNYTTGALFIVDNVLYKATSNIANGGTITPNTNCTATTLAEIISALA